MKRNGSITLGVAFVALATGGATLLTSCGAQEAPACSSQQVEDTVARLITNPDGPMRWGVRFNLPNGHLATALADIDVAGLAKALNFQFSNERERSYDKETKTRACTADVAANWDSSKADALVSVIPDGSERTPQSDYTDREIRRDYEWVRQGGDESSHVMLFTPKEPRKNELSPVKFDSATQHMLHAIFAGSIPRFVETVRWHKPQDYTVQVLEKGGILVTLN